MASVIQSVVGAAFNTSATADVTLTGVTAGSSIIIVCPLYGNIAASVPSATSYTAGSVAAITNGSSARSIGLLYRHNVAGGNTTVTVTTDAPVGYRFGYPIALEVSGLVNAAPHVQMPASSGTNGANSTAPATGNSSASTVTCFVVSGMTLAAGTADAGIDTPATTGYTNASVRQISTSEVAYSVDYKTGSAAGVQSAAWGTLTASAEWAAGLWAFEENATATVDITATSSATPAQGSSLTITCTGAGATQGTRDVRIGGVIQTPASWSDTSITVTVDRGSNKFGAALNVEVFNSGAIDSNSFALTSILPASGWDFVDIVSPASAYFTRLSARPDLAAGDQISWNTQGALVDVFSDATWSADPQVLSFPFEVWSAGSGWGIQATQVLYAAQVLDGRSDAENRLRTQRQRRNAAKLLDVRTWGGSALDARRWFADELEASAGGPVTLTATSSLGAAIQAAQAATASISAAVQAPLSSTSALGVAVQASLTGVASVGAAVQVAQSATATLAAAVQAAVAATASLTAYIQAGSQASASLEVAVQQARSATAAADVVVQAALSGSASLGAAVQAAGTAAAALGAAVQAAGTATASLGAYVQAGSVVVASLEAAIQRAATATASLDAALAVSGAATASLSAMVLSQSAVTASLGAAVRAAVASTAGLSAYVNDPSALVFTEDGRQRIGAAQGRAGQRIGPEAGAVGQRVGGRRL